MNVFQPPEPIDELGATTRRTLWALTIEGSVMRIVPIPDDRQRDSESELLWNPPCSIDGVDRLVIQVERFRRGDTRTPY